MLDAFRCDYFSEATTPFLWQFSNRENVLVSSTREPMGFRPGPAFLAGLYPEESGICALFKYSPQTSPFRTTRYSEWLGRLPKVGPRVRARLELEVSRRPEPVYRYTHTTAQIPLPLLRYFDYSEKGLPWEMNFRSPTLFELMRERNGDYLYLGNPIYTSPYDDEEIVNRLCGSLEESHKFVFVHLALLDGVGHAHGPGSPEVADALRETDSRVERTVSCLESKFRNFHLFVFADHGMVQVESLIPIWTELARLPCKLKKDYLVFLDSTLARFWFFSESSRDHVVTLLSHLGHGRILNEKDIERHRMRFKDRGYGDILFLADPGSLIHPSFFSVSRQAPKGMHGYDPDCRENQGLFLLHSNKLRRRESREAVELVDLYATAVRLMGFEVSESAHGEDLLSRVD